ncbi:MAG: ABC transporter permease [Ruminococcus flavefaciens]|nr:ABC transporter permease [Ruminococcus flavefaciens]
MKSRIKHIVIIILNAVAVMIICILTAVGHSMAVSQKYNSTAEIWKNNSKESFAQVSTFLSEDSGFTTDSLNSVRAELIKELNNSSIKTEDGSLPFADAYSSQMGTFTIRGDLTGRTDAVLTAVGGDFFMFRNFKLINGSFFSEDDLMQDGAVIDRSLAWSLYGSYNVAGMSLYINGVKFYISGVIENPETEPEQECIGKLPRIYISYDGAVSISNLSGNGESSGSLSAEIPQTVSSDFRKITCYETVLPNPVENFAYNAIKKQFSESYKDKYAIVKNSTRFSPSVRAKAFKKIADYAVIKNSINYPYWENASRLVEFKLTFIYFFRRVAFAVPVLTLIWLAVLAVKFAKKKKSVVLRAISIFIDRRRRDIKETLKNKQKKV